MKNKTHSVTLLVVAVTFAICIFGRQTAFAKEWDWVEDFSGGLNGWVSQVPGAWYIGDNGKLTYSNISGSGWRNFRYPDVVSLTDGFEIFVNIDYFDVTSVSHMGIMFTADEAMENFFGFEHADYKGTLIGSSYWGLNHYRPGLTYGYGSSTMPTPPTTSRVLRAEYDGSTLDMYVDETLVHSRTFPSAAHDITDGYVGLCVWDCGPYADHVEINSISYVPEPATLLLIGLGALMVRKRKKIS